MGSQRQDPIVIGINVGSTTVKAVVLDPNTVTDNATYFDSLRPSTGVRHLVVGGTLVVRDGVLDPTAFPGRAVRGEPA